MTRDDERRVDLPLFSYLPLVMIVLALLLALNGVGMGVALSALVAIAVNVGLAEADSRRLNSGVEISSWRAALFVAAYLFTRSSRLKQSYILPIVWCVCALISLGGSGLVSSVAGVAIDTQAVDTQVAKGIQHQTGIRPDVQCPVSVTVRPGSSCKCPARAAEQTVLVDVTVQNANGDIVWQVQN